MSAAKIEKTRIEGARRLAVRDSLHGRLDQILSACSDVKAYETPTKSLNRRKKMDREGS